MDSRAFSPRAPSSALARPRRRRPPSRHRRPSLKKRHTVPISPALDDKTIGLSADDTTTRSRASRAPSNMLDFARPILSLSPEVVKELDGEDALYGMWTVFTKCKQSLKDGRRLENISWRLWFREISYSHSPNSGTSSPALSDAGCPSPITPVSENGPQDVSDDSSESLLSVPQGPARHSWHGGGLPPPTSNIRRLSTASMPARPGARPHHHQPAGIVIMDILPDKFVLPSPAASRRPFGVSSRRAPTSNPSTAKPSPAQTSAASTLINSQMHQPAFTPGSVAQPRPTIQLPSPPSALSAPRVVVVNPTPHPTPPATPHPSNAAAVVALPPTAALHLAPPPLRPAFSVLPPASSLKPAAVIVQKDSSAPSSAEPPVQAVPQVSPTNKAPNLMDRRFFLQTSESPEQASPSPERSQAQPQDSLELPEASPASTTSSHVKSVKSDNAPAPPKRTLSKPTFRRGKEVARFTTAKSTAKLQRPTMTRKQTDSKKTTFNIGSASSNGTKADGHGQHLQRDPPVAHQPPAAQHSQQQQPPHKPSPPKKKGMTLSTDSDYTTDSGDDSDWASEGNSVEERDKEQESKESKLREAAEEARRQRDMFSKLPKRSYTDLTKRTNSGLLSQLLNPDPAIFPPNHPYRQTHSTMDMTQFARQHGGGRLPLPNYQTSRSSAAVPLAAQITPMNAQAPSTNGASAYRPKGRPQGEELETDTEEEGGTDNGIQLSTSLAQQKLAALAGPSRRRAPPSQTQTQTQANGPSGLARMKASQDKGGPLPSVATAPIPLNHPYNLPAPAPPMTPRTTRRQMLSTELSESLRRNLLWERQVSKANMLAGARRGSRVQPLTQGQGGGGGVVDEREERRRAAVARNRSWADDFHYAGW